HAREPGPPSRALAPLDAEQPSLLHGGWVASQPGSPAAWKRVGGPRTQRRAPHKEGPPEDTPKIAPPRPRRPRGARGPRTREGRRRSGRQDQPEQRRQGEGPHLARPRVVREARAADHGRRDEARRVAAGVQGGDREVRRAGEALPRRPEPEGLRRRAAVP